MSICYRQYQITDKSELVEMMQGLYTEDFEGKPLTISKINKTIKELTEKREKGEILILEKNQIIIGYSILINYWSNEYGGNILVIDELYIKSVFRKKNVATDFIKFLIEKRFSNSIAIQLEIMPSNNKAKRLFEKAGFKLSDRNHYLYDYSG